jgi:hypothetical protein
MSLPEGSIAGSAHSCIYGEWPADLNAGEQSTDKPQLTQREHFSTLALRILPTFGR